MDIHKPLGRKSQVFAVKSSWHMEMMAKRIIAVAMTPTGHRKWGLSAQGGQERLL